jgi:hypothetical protein
MIDFFAKVMRQDRKSSLAGCSKPTQERLTSRCLAHSDYIILSEGPAFSRKLNLSKPEAQQDSC